MHCCYPRTNRMDEHSARTVLLDIYFCRPLPRDALIDYCACAADYTRARNGARSRARNEAGVDSIGIGGARAQCRGGAPGPIAGSILRLGTAGNLTCRATQLAAMHCQWQWPRFHARRRGRRVRVRCQWPCGPMRPAAPLRLSGSRGCERACEGGGRRQQAASAPGCHWHPQPAGPRERRRPRRATPGAASAAARASEATTTRHNATASPLSEAQSRGSGCQPELQRT
jgi:hypothetical protein